MAEDGRWVSIIRSVRTPPALLALFVLAGQAAFSLFIASEAFTAADMSTFLIGNFVLLGLLFVLLFATFNLNPEVLGGSRYQPLTTPFAESLGKDVYDAFDGYLRNESPSVRKGAYDNFGEMLKNSSYYSHGETREFMQTFRQTILDSVDLRGRYRDVGGPVEPKESN